MNRFSPLGDEAGFRGDPLLYNLVYCSRAAEAVGHAAVNGIIAAARRNNPAYGITGLLFFGGGLFLQWLEGPRSNVLRLLQNLEADRRHHDLVVLSRSEEVRERLFGDWDKDEPMDAEDVNRKRTCLTCRKPFRSSASTSSTAPSNADTNPKINARQSVNVQSQYLPLALSSTTRF